MGCKRQKPPAMTRVWLGPFHGCATLKSGELECWGANDVGQLGDGTTNQSALPVPTFSEPSRDTNEYTPAAIGRRMLSLLMTL